MEGRRLIHLTDQRRAETTLSEAKTRLYVQRLFTIGNVGFLRINVGDMRPDAFWATVIAEVFDSNEVLETRLDRHRDVSRVLALEASEYWKEKEWESDLEPPCEVESTNEQQGRMRIPPRARTIEDDVA
jgi:hypothetical protein